NKVQGVILVDLLSDSGVNSIQNGLATASGLQTVDNNVDLINNTLYNSYYADIKFIKDNNNNQDEYYVSWFKNDQPLSSGDVNSSSFQVWRKNGTTLINHTLLNYIGNFGVLYHDEAANITASGEAYLVTTSGIIDGNLRE